VEPGFHGPERQSEPIGDGVERKIRPETEDDDDPLVGTQAIEPNEELFALEERLERIAPRWVDVPRHRDEPNDATPSEPIAAVVDDDPVEPRTKLGWLAQATEGLPGENEAVLDRVFGLMGIRKEKAGQPKGPIKTRAGGSQEPLAAVGIGRADGAGRRSFGHSRGQPSHVDRPDERPERKVLEAAIPFVSAKLSARGACLDEEQPVTGMIGA
jgi:hypothetical protein